LRPVPTHSFAAVMGIAGLGLAWRTAAKTGYVAPAIGEWLLALATAVFVVLLVLWLRRIATFPNEVIAENNSAITASFYPTVVISCSELAAGALPYSRPFAFALWAIAALASVALLLYLLGRWILRGIKDTELTPALLIPVAGNATAVYASVPLGMRDVGWALFSFASIGWIVIGPLIMYRLLVVEPRLPTAMGAQLAVFTASLAVMSNGWFLLDGGIAGPTFMILAFSALFFALLSLRLWRFISAAPFAAGTWAWTFAGASLAGAFVRGAAANPSPMYVALAVITLAAATVIVAWCVYATVSGWLKNPGSLWPTSMM
jgi:tellurite resistance protein